MIPKKKATNQLRLFSLLRDTLDQNTPLYILAEKINWKHFEEAFLPLYCAVNWCPAKLIRLMVGLLILKHLRNRSNEVVVEEWKENVYCQYFCGEQVLQVCFPCNPTELVHFRNKIGVKRMKLIFQRSFRINGKDSENEHVSIDTKVQEKDIAFPIDQQLHRKIIYKCNKIADKEQIRNGKAEKASQKTRGYPANHRPFEDRSSHGS